MLLIEDLHVEVYGKEILHGVNLEVPAGEVHALFGPNGAGKSVMNMTIMGYPDYEITGGKIVMNGEVINDLSIEERVELGIAISEQRPPTIKGVKLKNLFELLIPEGDPRKQFSEDMIEKFRIDRFLERNINEGLSGGEIKQSELFLVLITQPKLLMLDEPDSGVDPEVMKKIGSMVNESFRDHSIPNFQGGEVLRHSGLIATHSASILNYIETDRAHILMDGKIRCSGNSREMMMQIREKGFEYCIECQHKGAA